MIKTIDCNPAGIAFYAISAQENHSPSCTNSFSPIRLWRHKLRQYYLYQTPRPNVKKNPKKRNPQIAYSVVRIEYVV